MTQKERLVELIKDEIDCDKAGIIPEWLADYLLANGVIVPPCKVGDTVYQIDGVRVYESTIKNVIYDTNGVAFDEDAIGKTVFLTREEAEKALAETTDKNLQE
jgi:hypothetical protein